MGRRIRIVRATFGAIESSLHFPDGHRIAGLRLTDTFSNTFEIAVESEFFSEVPDGHEIPRVDYVVTVDEGTDLVPTRAYIGKFSGAL